MKNKEEIMPLSDLFHEEFLFNPAPYDPERDTLQVFCAFKSCFKPGFTSRGGEKKYALYSLNMSGSYETQSGKIISSRSFVWSRSRAFVGKSTVLGDEDVKRKVLMLHQNPIHELLSSQFLPSANGSLPLADIGRVELIYDLIFEELTQKSVDNPRLAGLFVQLLHEVISQQRQSPYSAPVEKILSFISRNLDDTELSRTLISERCGVSLRTLDRFFAKELNSSVTRYIISARLNKVHSLLALPELQIKSIAARCGFSSAAFMTYSFRKRFGMTPTEYRKELQFPSGKA